MKPKLSIVKWTATELTVNVLYFLPEKGFVDEDLWTHVAGLSLFRRVSVLQVNF